jgi:hypothetical protein
MGNIALTPIAVKAFQHLGLITNPSSPVKAVDTTRTAPDSH